MTRWPASWSGVSVGRSACATGMPAALGETAPGRNPSAADTAPMGSERTLPESAEVLLLESDRDNVADVPDVAAGTWGVDAIAANVVMAAAVSAMMVMSMTDRRA